MTRAGRGSARPYSQRKRNDGGITRARSRPSLSSAQKARVSRASQIKLSPCITRCVMMKTLRRHCSIRVWMCSVSACVAGSTNRIWTSICGAPTTPGSSSIRFHAGKPRRWKYCSAAVSSQRPKLGSRTTFAGPQSPYCTSMEQIDSNMMVTCGDCRVVQGLGSTAVASSSILPGLSSRSATKIMLMAG